MEYCDINLDGTHTDKNVRNIKSDIIDCVNTERTKHKLAENEYIIRAIKCRDHVLITINDGHRIISVTAALPDSARYAYLTVNSENCLINNMSIDRADKPVATDYIPRIADEVSYVDGPEGDIPNIQINGFKYDATEGIPITDGLKLSFHAKSLPTARLIWHCPYIDIFHSSDKKMCGKDYSEYVLVRLDGEDWEDNEHSKNILTVIKKPEFKGWDEWKAAYKEGIDCTVYFERKDNTITVTTENLGLYIKNTVTVTDGSKEIYAALTGDQCVITNIRTAYK